MAAHGQTDQGTELTGPVDFDQPSQKGWDFFTKFILWNVITIIGVLLVVGLLPVWS